ncbi:MAG: hypothetical protein ACKO4S_15840 [Snowella sp.]
MSLVKKWLKKGISLGLGFMICFLLTVHFGNLVPVQGQDLSLINEVIGTPSSTQPKTPSSEIPNDASELPDAFPVTFDGIELWKISAPFEGITAQTRAQGQTKRIQNLADDFSMKPEDVSIVKPKGFPTLYLRTKEFFLLSITPEDAKIA